MLGGIGLEKEAWMHSYLPANGFLPFRRQKQTWAWHQQPHLNQMNFVQTLGTGIPLMKTVLTLLRLLQGSEREPSEWILQSLHPYRIVSNMQLLQHPHSLRGHPIELPLTIGIQCAPLGW